MTNLGLHCPSQPTSTDYMCINQPHCLTQDWIQLIDKFMASGRRRWVMKSFHMQTQFSSGRDYAESLELMTWNILF